MCCCWCCCCKCQQWCSIFVNVWKYEMNFSCSYIIRFECEYLHSFSIEYRIQMPLLTVFSHFLCNWKFAKINRKCNAINRKNQPSRKLWLNHTHTLNRLMCTRADIRWQYVFINFSQSMISLQQYQLSDVQQSNRFKCFTCFGLNSGDSHNTLKK